uniref:Lipoprotein n=1 Tax=Thermomicrobium roseum TaxID=500 RepID=A0A7C2B653_THERO
MGVTRIPIRSMLVCGILALVLAACISSDETVPSTQPASQSPVTTAPTASPDLSHTATSREDESELVATLYEMLGHLEASRANLERGNWTLVQAHAAHPTAEYWASVEAALTARNLASVRGALDDYLEAAKQQANDAASRNDTARQAVQNVIRTIVDESPEPSVTRAAALALLAESIATEFSEGVENGRIVNVEEFQDSWGFFHVLRSELPIVLSTAPASGQGAITEAQEDLEALAQTTFAQFSDTPGAKIPEADTARERLQHLASELRDAFGISASATSSTEEQLAKIRDMLAAALQAYRAGDTDRAYEEAANAYLEGFEALEPALLERGHRELVEQLERDFKAIRDAIRAGRPAGEVEQLIRNVESALEEVEEVLR